MKQFFLTFFTLFLMHSLSWGSAEAPFTKATIELKDGTTVTRFHYGIVESTQITAKKHLNPKQWSIVTSESQNNGYGLWGRRWMSPEGNIFSTFCVPLDLTDISRISWVPLFVGLAVCDALLELGVPNEKIGLRWINNVLVDGEKIAGILVETDLKTNVIMLRIGIGINIDIADEILGKIDQPATSLRSILETVPTRDDVLKALTQKLRNRFLASQNGESPVAEYRSKLLYVGEPVTIFDGKKKTPGRFKGLTDEGFLQLDTLSYGRETFISGEIVPKKKDGL